MRGRGIRPTLSWSRLSILNSRRGLHALSSGANRATTIGFIGLGRMGFEMATNLFTKTIVAHQTGSSIVCDVNQDATQTIISKMKEKFPEYEVIVAKSPAEVVSLSSTLVTMLPSSPQVKDSADAIVPALAKLANGEPTLLIDSTTLDIEVARDVAAKAEAAGAMMVDAPVSGGVSGARAGTLSFMVGGPQPSVTLAQPYLSLMGARSIHCGPSGSGLAAKICNNMILGVQQIVVAEGMLLGERMGLKPDVLAGVLNSSTGRCWSSEVNNPVPGALPNSSPPCTRDYDGGFATALMLKDMNLALQAASTFTSPLILGATAKDVYENVAKHGTLAQKDFSVVYQVLKVAAEAQAAQATQAKDESSPASTSSS
ncbi:probable 3-hydroxyisobutyrate dehydrogenase, mitochondrial precursor [Serendipita indica DSM 11827]|uniref:3-hydroxyisobutyrate dehydrogenase n=1 Tax=Serendipita indica (strain DSM 11827) TaxID=1109443 RepID=G4TUM8_SERID|nr:probable 3-hydroxyisobutyrate dehydrogenase, mitochondrial precursor [Serendipita indica DSM 11827]